MEAPEIPDDEKEERREQFQAVTGAADQIADTLLEVGPAPPRRVRMIAERCRRAIERARVTNAHRRRSAQRSHPRPLTNIGQEWVGEAPVVERSGANCETVRGLTRTFSALRRRARTSCKPHPRPSNPTRPRPALRARAQVGG